MKTKPNYFFTIVIFILGLSILAISVYFDVKNFYFVNQTVEIGKTKTIKLSKGKYTIFLNNNNIEDIVIENNTINIISNVQPISFNLLITDKYSNEQVNFNTLRDNLTLEFNSSMGILSINIDKSSDYEISTSFSNDIQHSSYKLIISNVFTSQLIFMIMKDIGILGLTVLSTFISFILIYTKRKRYLRNNS